MSVSVRCREYVYQDGKSNKYWTYFIPDTTYSQEHWFAHSGRIGTAGVWHTFLYVKVLPQDRRIEKRNEGYQPNGPEVTIVLTFLELENMKKNIDRELLGKRFDQARKSDAALAHAKPQPRSQVPGGKNRSELQEQLDRMIDL